MPWRCSTTAAGRRSTPAATSRPRAAWRRTTIAKWDGSSWSPLGSGMNNAGRCPGGVRRRQRAGALRRRRLHDRGRRGGEQDREVGRLELVGARQRDEQRGRPCPDGVRRRQRAGALRRWQLHDRGRRGGEQHREVGRLELVAARQRDVRRQRSVRLCPDGVRRRRRAGALRRRRLHDRGRRGGEQHREVGRLELGGARQRDERLRRLP